LYWNNFEQTVFLMPSTHKGQINGMRIWITKLAAAAATTTATTRGKPWEWETAEAK